MNTVAGTVGVPGSADASGRVPRARRPALPAAVRDSLLRLPLFHKIFLAGLAWVLVTAALAAVVAGALYGVRPGMRMLELFVVVALVGVGLTAPVQRLLVHLALAPLRELERAAQRVERGDVDSRVPVSPLADPQMQRVGQVLNRLLDAVQGDRERLREIAARAFRAQEAERMRIAHELQDEWAQHLAGLQLQLRLARSAARGTGGEGQLESLRDGLAELTGELRSYARGLHPPALRELGLRAALQGYGRTLGETTGLQVQVRGDDVRGLLSADPEVALYRVVQEALANVVRHARASRAQVVLTREADRVVVRVEDDGIGFDVERTRGDSLCLGLFGMQERVLYAGGSVQVESEPGRGTRVTITAPLNGQPGAARLAG